MSTTKVFIPNEEHVWVTGQIVVDVDSKGDVQVKIQDEVFPNETATKTISLAKLGLPSLPQQNLEVPPQGVEDMTKLNYLHEPSILDNLKRRFAHKLPYTYTGEVCVAVNPYQWLPLYTDALRATYSKSTRHELSPHVYATSADGYRGLTTRAKNQSILVTGESGAGKTETVKILMGHLAYIAGKSDDKTVAKLLKANPLLESFGNAKTGRNDNSSRFGKFSQMEFDDMYALVGSKCITYLLEKSRVITQTKLERNFHVMYQLLAAPEPVKARLQLAGKKNVNFNYTNNGDTKLSVIEGKSDAEHYLATMSGLEVLGVGPKLRALVEEAIAGILHMGQVAFNAGKGNSDSATMVKNGNQPDEATVATCKMLGVAASDFESCVVSRVIEVEGKKLPVPLNIEQATSGRDALAKEIYSRLFNWLVLIINFETSYACNATSEQLSRTKNCSTISLLDIFGFECFAVNGFEQFCINFANEKLQQRFTHDVFMTVQREYQEEGLPWETIKYKDNQDTLDMIEGRLGIIDMLNEECQIPKGTDLNFLTKIKQNFQSHYAFSVDPRSRESFVVRHYAGPVQYTVHNFMDSNKDAVPNNLETMLMNSTSPLLKRLFADTPYFRSEPELLLAEDNDFVRNFLLLSLDTKEGAKEVELPESLRAGINSSNQRGGAGAAGGRARAGTTAGGQNKASGGFVVSEKILTKFKNQLGNLMEMVNATDVQYVRCIKPNPNKSNTEYNRRMVVEQLRSAGMIEAVRISRAAFPNRLLYSEFMGRFHLLRPKKWHDSVLKNLAGKSPVEQLKGTTQEFLKWAVPDNKKDVVDGTGTTTHYAFGNTKVYFTSYVLEKLEAARNKAVYSHVTAIQKVGRGYVCRKIYARQLAALKVLGRLVRTSADRMKLYKMKKALRLLQSICVMRFIRKKYLPIRDAYRKDKNLKKGQESLEIELNMAGMRERYLEERTRKAAEAEEKRLKLLEEKRLIEEAARKVEEDRLRAIEEKKQAEEAKLRYYETLEAKVKEQEEFIATLQANFEEEQQKNNDAVAKLAATAATIELLKKAEVDAKSAVDREKALYKQLQVRCDEAQAKASTLEKSNVANKTAIEEADARAKLIEARMLASTTKLASLEASERSLKANVEDEQSKYQALEKKLAEAAEKKAALEASERALKVEVEDNRERLESAEARYKKAESSIVALNQNEIVYKETIENETAKQSTMSTRLAEALAKISALELIAASVTGLREENERLKEAETNLEIANDSIASMRKREISLKSQLADEAAKLSEALMTIEDLEKRPATGLGDGTSVLSGLNDMEIVIDEHQGKMKVIITKRRPEGDNGLGPVERITL